MEGPGMGWEEWEHDLGKLWRHNNKGDESDDARHIGTMQSVTFVD